MEFEIVIGRSGSGKSYDMIDSVITESMEHPENNYFVVVPEQFTMETQRSIVTRHKRRGTMNIDIVSFLRLTIRIFNELQVETNEVLEDFGKSMVIRKILGEKKNEMPLFAGCMNKPGFIDEVKSLLSELYQYEISPGQLDEISKEQGNTVVGRKLQEVSLVYQAFEDYIRNHYIVAEQMTGLLSQVVMDSELLKNSVIYFDGFTGFTPIQYHLIRSLTDCCKKLVFAITIDPEVLTRSKVEQHDLFYLSYQTIVELQKIAAEKQAEVLIRNTVEPATCRYEGTKELAHLEAWLFRMPYRAYQDEVNRIHGTAYRTMRDEAYAAARTIRMLVEEQGYRYREIAVICGDLEGMSTHVFEAFTKLEIPYFIDANQELMVNPCLEAIRGLLQMVIENYSYESVFRYLKSGMSCLSMPQIERLENFVLKYNLRGFESYVACFCEDSSWKEIQEKPDLLEAGKTFVNEVTNLNGKLQSQSATVGYLAEAILEHVKEQHYEEKLQAKQEAFAEEGLYQYADSYGQVFERISDIVNKMIQLLGQEKVTVEEFVEIMEVGVSKLQLGVVPPTMDQVMVGNMERTRLGEIKVLFFCNLNEGLVPTLDNGGGILSEREKEALAEQLVLAPTAKENLYIQQFYIYLTMSKPKEELFLSYHKLNEEHTGVRASYVVDKITRLFPKLVFCDKSREEIAEECCYTVNDSKTYYLTLLTKAKEQGSLEPKQEHDFLALQKIYREHGDVELRQMMEGITFQQYDSTISKKVAKALYGEQMRMSVSRLEKYANCPYSYFLKYGLGLEERELFEISTADIGTILHGTMEKLFTRVRDDESLAWETMTEEQLVELTNGYMEEAVADQKGDAFQSAVRTQYLKHMLTRLANRSTKTLKSQLQLGMMKPRYFEHGFNMGTSNHLSCTEIELQDGCHITLNGIIDRVDVCEQEDVLYVDVIDYKSGAKDVDMKKVYHGLQLQLMVYMNVIREELAKRYPEKNIVPTGMFYYHFSDPIIEKKSTIDTEEKIQGKIMETLALKGLVREDEETILLMDKNHSGMVLPVKYDKEGNRKDSASLASGEQLDELRSFILDKIQELGNEMITGNIAAYPASIGRKVPCEYCEYHSICHFDQKNGHRCHYIPAMKNQEVWDRLHEMYGGNEDELD